MTKKTNPSKPKEDSAKDILDKLGVTISSQAPTKELQKITDKKHNKNEDDINFIFKEMNALNLKKADMSMFGINISQIKKSPDKINNVKKQVKDISDKTSFNALELLNLNIESVPKLVEPFFQKSGLASLVGTSDTGKSTFLRQLALSIVLQKEDFIGFKLKPKHNKVIYVSTEDGAFSVSHSIRKQIKSITDKNDDLDLIKNLTFLFDTDNLYERLEDMITESPVDLIIIDAFTDVFSNELNSNTQVRNFLNTYDSLAKKNDCLVVFLHHTGKRTQNNKPSKDSIIGSQAFEAKMKVVLEIRSNSKSHNLKDLWVLKSNFLENDQKNQSHILNFSNDLTFSNTGQKGSKSIKAKSNNKEILNKVIELHSAGNSFRKIEELLKGTNFEISKTAANNLIKEHKKGGN
ncbi:AAA family ATPase [Polaribacter ponticola]|uniref:AAA family ATPase n=1 Tax=Polaribacter ponticola TaxID=2978475 RepID=A0ABT5S6E2_9FLAO|nr:AAA family ATPase [Polaribacter sp. MSW5]MDD7913185.1 AAA family ATPase [Polaribacter sp. MSW5]